MDPRDALAQLGGVAQSTDLLRLTTRKRLRTALDRGDVERLARGRYRLPDADRALARAARAGGVVSHLSAAVVHGWEVAHPPTLPWVTVSRKAKVTDRRAVNLVYGDLTDERVVTGCTRTVVDCARRPTLSSPSSVPSPSRPGSTWSRSARDAFDRDCWRYTVLALAGWRVLRFTHFQVMQQPDWVVSCLRAAASGVSVTGSLDPDGAT